MKTHSLTHRTMVQFFICTVVIFLLMAPLFYLLTKHFYAEDLIDLIEAVKNGHGIPELDLERDIMAGIMLQFLLIFFTLSIAMYVTVRFITRRLWHPFDDTLAKTENFNLAQNDLPEFYHTDIREFNRLNDSLIRLISNNRNSYLIQKEFTENASHELQTPLAVTRSKLDLLMQEDLDARQYELVSELYDLNTRMGRLNRNLLLLAKIENRQYTETERISLSGFIENLIPSYNLLKGECRVSFDNLVTGERFIDANPILLECLLNNLVVNAIRHTGVGNVSVCLCDDGSLWVKNPGEAALDPGLIFHRFASGDSDTQGTGLGLAIVKAICEFHEWDVSYCYTDGQHVFIVKIG